MGLFLFWPGRMTNNRVTYRRRTPYNTASNKTRIVKTPGGKLTIQYRTKAAKGPKCGDCGVSLPGIPHLRPKAYSRVSRCQKNVTRAYGGSRCGNCVRDRIVRAFLVEEQRAVKAKLKSQAVEQQKTQKEQQAAPAKGAAAKNPAAAKQPAKGAAKAPAKGAAKAPAAKGKGKK